MCAAGPGSSRGDVTGEGISPGQEALGLPRSFVCCRLDFEEKEGPKELASCSTLC